MNEAIDINSEVSRGLREYKISYVKIVCIMILLFGAFMTNSRAIAMLASLVFWIIVAFSSISDDYALLFFSYPLSGIFDGVGFGYFFNLTLVLFTGKLFLRSVVVGKRISRRVAVILGMIIILATYDLIIANISGMFSLGYITNFSIWISLFFLVITATMKKWIDVNKILIYSFAGFFFAAGLCLINVLRQWGSISSVPTAYRFIGMLRDANYYALFGVVISFAILNYINALKGKILFVVTMIVTLFSISKMSILLYTIGIFLYCLSPFLEKKARLKKRTVVCVLLSIAAIVLLFDWFQNTSIYGMLADKFTFRLDNNSLTTGRDHLQSFYIDKFFSDPSTMIFGKSLNYNIYYNATYSVYENMVAHNTYIDMLLSFGLVGTVFYMIVLIKTIELYKYNFNSIIKLNRYILPFLFMLSLLALSYLKADGFSVMIAFLCIMTLFDTDKNSNKGII